MRYPANVRREPCIDCGATCRGRRCQKCYRKHVQRTELPKGRIEEVIEESMPERAPSSVECPQCGSTDDRPGINPTIDKDLWALNRKLYGCGGRAYRDHTLTGVKVLSRGIYETEYVCMECGKSWEVPRGD